MDAVSGVEQPGPVRSIEGRSEAWRDANGKRHPRRNELHRGPQAGDSVDVFDAVKVHRHDFRARFFGNPHTGFAVELPSHRIELAKRRTDRYLHEHRLVATDGARTDRDLLTRTTVALDGFAGRSGRSGNAGVERGDERERDGDFRDGVFGERNANGVPETFFQEDADAEGRLDAPVGAVPSLRHTQVQRIVHAERVHAAGEQTIDVEHDGGIRGLHRQDEVAIVPVLADANEFQRGFDHSLR